jgi:hypothetical protein
MVILSVLYVSCDDIYDNIKEFSVEEIVYPAHFDTVFGRIGYERVEIDLSKAGRVPSNRMKLGKATKTIVEYDGKEVVFDSVCSWVNIKGLTKPSLYRFTIYSVNNEGDRSTPVEIALTPFTATDTVTLAISTPNVASSSTAAVIEWPNGISSTILEYCGLSYSYTDKDGVVREGERGQQSSQFFVGNMGAGLKANIKMRYKVVPKVDKKSILDTLILKENMEIVLPSASAPFYPNERTILEANGVTEFTSAGTVGITRLAFPLHVKSLLDIFYFSDLKEVDLTGEGLPLTSLTYSANGYTSRVGGGNFSPCIRKIDNLTGGVEMLVNLLESGILEKVRYTPHSLGPVVEEALAPFVETGQVELVSPNDVLIPHQFKLDERAREIAWTIDYTYPATDATDAAGLSEVYKCVFRQKNASFVFALPLEYKFNAEEYRYLKLKVYGPPKSVLEGSYSAYQRLWFRFVNYIWGVTQYGYPGAGQGYWEAGVDNYIIPDAELQTWKDFTVDLTRMVNTYNNVIIINIGGEPSLTFNPPNPIVYYFANIRLSKTP